MAIFDDTLSAPFERSVVAVVADRRAHSGGEELLFRGGRGGEGEVAGRVLAVRGALAPRGIAPWRDCRHGG